MTYRSTTGVALGSCDSVRFAKCKDYVSSMNCMYWKNSVLIEGVTVFEEHKNWRFNPDEFIPVDLLWTCLSIHVLTFSSLCQSMGVTLWC